MKKTVLNTNLAIKKTTNGQKQIINKKLKLNNTPEGTATDKLLVIGEDKIVKYIPVSTIKSTTPDATISEKGKLKLTGDLGGTADLPTTPTALHKTGDETKNGKLTILNSVVNPSGLFLNNTNNGSILNITNNGSFSAFTGQTSGSGALIDVGSIGSGTVIKATSSVSGMNYIGTDGSNQTFSVSGKGALIAKTLAVSGGQNTEVLLADGTKNFIDRTLLGNFTTYIPSSKAVKDYVDASKRPYKVYSALISQTGTSAPVAVVLENTIGSIDWDNSGTPGSYVFNAPAGSFPVDKTMCFYSRPRETSTTSSTDVLIIAGTNPYNTSNGSLQSLSIRTLTGIDGALSRLSFEIRVYN